MIDNIRKQDAGTAYLSQGLKVAKFFQKIARFFSLNLSQKRCFVQNLSASKLLGKFLTREATANKDLIRKIADLT